MEGSNINSMSITEFARKHGLFFVSTSKKVSGIKNTSANHDIVLYMLFVMETFQFFFSSKRKFESGFINVSSVFPIWSC